MSQKPPLLKRLLLALCQPKVGLSVVNAEVLNIPANDTDLAPATEPTTENAANTGLSDIISGEEKLARNLLTGGKTKHIRNLYLDIQTKTRVSPIQFLDSRYPTELSVNRISTLSEDESHELGCVQRDDYNANNPQTKIYYGFAAVLAEICHNLQCEIKKEDYNGTQPFHANIIYPLPQKEDSMEIANQLADHAVLIHYSKNGS